MADLHVDFLGKRLAGPVVAASGTFGFGPEYAGIEDLRVLGGISGKGLTLHGQPGNEGERLYETPSGLMNSIGLQNPGVQHFIDHELPAMRRCGTTVWANLGGHTIDENVEGVMMLCAAGVDFIELNISCPNVKQGGLAFGIRAADASEVVSAVRKVCNVPLIVKLSPQAESIPEMCKAVEAAGADAISLCNTFQACAIDLEKRRPVFNNTFAGLSGPAVRPIALRMVWQAVGGRQHPGRGTGRHSDRQGRTGVHHGRCGRRAGGHREFPGSESLHPHHERDQPVDGRSRRQDAGGDPRLRKIKAFPLGGRWPKAG